MNLKLFKPLNEQIQVIKIKRQGIADSEREELIESIINGDAVESLTEDVELASISFVDALVPHIKMVDPIKSLRAAEMIAFCSACTLLHNSYLSPLGIFSFSR